MQESFMIEYQDIILSSEQYKTLCSSFLDGNAFLFESDDEVYLNNFSLMFAKHLMCKNESTMPCSTCQNCLKVDLLSHSDLHIYPKSAKTVVVSDIKDLLDNIYLAPLESDKKIFIFNNFSSATPQAQNKLLKVLEEPPANSYIILNVSNVNKVLPTVLSRCQKTKLLPIENKLLIRVLQSKSEKNLESILALVDGNLTKALRYSSQADFDQIYNAVLDAAVKMKQSKEVIKYSYALSEKMDNLSLIIELFEAFFRDMLLLKLGKENLVLDKSSIESLASVLDEYSPDAIDLIIKRLYLVRKEMEFNCNKTTIIDSFLLYILEVKYLCKE